jgi:hypothetical protein
MNDFTNTYLHCLNNNVDQHISDNLIALVFQPFTTHSIHISLAQAIANQD